MKERKNERMKERKYEKKRDKTHDKQTTPKTAKGREYTKRDINDSWKGEKKLNGKKRQTNRHKGMSE